MRLNLNEEVSVELTKSGADIYNSYWIDYKDPSKKEGDVIKEQFWHLFQVFGEHIYLGCEMPFKDCEVIIGGF